MRECEKSAENALASQVQILGEAKKEVDEAEEEVSVNQLSEEQEEEKADQQVEKVNILV